MGYRSESALSMSTSVDPEVSSSSSTVSFRQLTNESVVSVVDRSILTSVASSAVLKTKSTCPICETTISTNSPAHRIGCVLFGNQCRRPTSADHPHRQFLLKSISDSVSNRVTVAFVGSRFETIVPLLTTNFRSALVLKASNGVAAL